MLQYLAIVFLFLRDGAFVNSPNTETSHKQQNEFIVPKNVRLVNLLGLPALTSHGCCISDYKSFLWMELLFILCTGTYLLPLKFLPKGSVHVENRRSITSITECSKHISCKRRKSRKEKTLEKGKRKYSD